MPRSQLTWPHRRKSSAAPAPHPDLPSIEERVAAQPLACPVDPSHAIQPWTDREPGRPSVPGAVTGACPRCESRMQRVRALVEVD